MNLEEIYLKKFGIIVKFFMGLIVLSIPAIVNCQNKVTPENIDWHVFERPLGCGISESGESKISSDLIFWRPFRGNSIILMEVAMPSHALFSVGKQAGSLLLLGNMEIPIFARWTSSMDPNKPGWPVTRTMSFEIDVESEKRFKDALPTARTARISTKDGVWDIALPSNAAWQQAGECAKHAGEELFTSAPPAYKDGSLGSRLDQSQNATAAARLMADRKFLASLS